MTKLLYKKVNNIMASRYKLSYTASEIDERLGRIDTLQKQIEQIPNQDQAGGSGATSEQIEQIEKNTNNITFLLDEYNSRTVINVCSILGNGTESEPIDLSELDIHDSSIVYFQYGTYYVLPLDLTDKKNITIFAKEAKIISAGDYFITGIRCDGFELYGGEIDCNNLSTFAIQLNDSKRCNFYKVNFKNVGNESSTDTAMLKLLGDCTGFNIEMCTFDNCTSGVATSDGFIHSYGLQINRLSSSKNYSKNGIVKNCMFNNITSVGTGETNATYGDGDGIFIQAPPYKDDEDNIIIPISNIKISNCIFENCKKRGIKIAARGVIVEDCIFDGDFWFAGIDMQYGFTTVKNCKISNTSDYTNSITSTIVISDGGVVIDSCELSAKYIGSDGNNAYHPAIRFNTRLSNSVITDDIPWDTCKINNCYFNDVSRGVYGNDSNSGATGKYVLNGIEITNCRWGNFVGKYGVELKKTLFSSINVMKFVDFQFDYGKNKTEVKIVLGTDGFTYPYLNEVTVNYGFELYSQYWTDEPMSGWNNLPTAPNTKILYSSYNNGANMGGILHKEYTAFGSKIIGTKDPSSVTSTMGKQMLYNSKLGDTYINRSNGTMWICTAVGSDSAIGTWTRIS